MTRSSSFAAEAACLCLLALAACSEQPAILMHVERAAREPLSLYVCAPGGTACEMWKIYELDFQQMGSVGCERVDVGVGDPIAVTVTLGMPLASTGCPPGRCTSGLPARITDCGTMSP